MSELPKVFTVLDEINELYRELTHSLREGNLPTSEKRVDRLVELAKQAIMDAYGPGVDQGEGFSKAEFHTRAAEIREQREHVFVGTEPWMIRFSWLEYLFAPAFDEHTNKVLRVRIRELKKAALGETQAATDVVRFLADRAQAKSGGVDMVIDATKLKQSEAEAVLVNPSLKADMKADLKARIAKLFS